MNMNSDDVIEKLIADLEPVQPLRQRGGMAWALIAMAISAIIAVSMFGARADVLSGQPNPLFMTASGLLLVLAMASAWAAIDMARPSVGTRRDGWTWTATMASVLPVGALCLIAIDLFTGRPVSINRHGIECLAGGAAAGMLTMGTLVIWVRRGAPTSLRLTGTLIGTAAGAAGSFAASLCCPENSLIHIGIWHVGAVVLMAVLGRLILPRYLAW